MHKESLRQELLWTSVVSDLFFALLILAIMLVGCKPSASPSTILPSAPTLTETSLRHGVEAKLTQIAQATQVAVSGALIPQSPLASPKITLVPASPVPLSTAFPPISGQGVTPAGSGFILQSPLLPFNAGRYFIKNAWTENLQSSSQNLVVYAGELLTPAGQETGDGVVFVIVSKITVKNNRASIERIEESEHPIRQSGPLKVIGATGERLVLQSATTGITSYFDVPLRQFVPSLTWTPTPGQNSPIATPTQPPATALP